MGLDEPSLILVLYSVLIGPVCEELIFRGLTLKYAKRAMPFWVANFLQALLFGVFHMNMIQGVYAFVVGIVLGFICEKSRSIYPSMLFHILFNIWGTFSPDWFMYKAGYRSVLLPVVLCWCRTTDCRTAPLFLWM